jgi:hypothetical protein
MQSYDITIPSSDLIKELLLDQTHRSISPLLAQILYVFYKNKHTIHIQFEHCTDWRAEKPQVITLERPILWLWDAWIQSDIRNNNIKTYEHNRRVQSWIDEENVFRVSKFCKSFLYMDDNAARATAHKMVHGKKYKQIKALGCTNLVTKEEELV